MYELTPPRDELAERPRYDPRQAAGSSGAYPSTQLQGFDVVRLFPCSDRFKLENGIQLYGPFTIYEVPQNVDRAVIRRLGVQMSPDAFCLKFFWWLQVGGGPVQEFVPDSRCLDQNVLVKAAAGFRYSAFPPMMSPDEVQIEVGPASTLQLMVGTEVVASPLPANFYVRARGYLESRAPRGV